MSLRKGLGFLLAPVVLAAGSLAHIRLLNPANAAMLRWASPASIRIVIASRGSDDIPSDLHVPALRGAIAAWNGVPGTIQHLLEDTSSSQQARTDWPSDDLHQILFDETNASGYFPAGTGIVALTPVWFAGNGVITDADVLFNGSGFSFTTSGQAGSFDVEDVGAHELGHLLGLDHSGWAGATMYPYVSPTVILHRSLSLDEEHAMRDAYPAASFASISGTIRRQADGTAVAGAHVVARDAAGRTVAGALANRLGSFQLRGLDPGTYLVYATPLDAPVSAGNLAAGNTVRTDFSSTVLGTFAVAAGQALAIGDQLVAADAAIGLGRSSDPFPLRGIAGQIRNLSLRGVGLDPGSSLSASDPTLTVVPLAWMSGAVSFQLTVPAGAAPGHVDLTATNAAGDRSILAAAVEITPANPQVSVVSPSSGTSDGGTPVTITGTGFNPGARVVLGPGVYEDGEPGGSTVVDPTTIQLTTRATPGGYFDAVVIDPTGVEGRLSNGFLFLAAPAISSVFPPAGDAAGGTEVVLRGTSFVAGCTVTIDGVVQTQTNVDDSTRITLVTKPGVAGGPYTLSVQNPGGATSSSFFSYSAAADPALDAVAPARGRASGGEVVTLHGANLPADAAVVFGADPDTGLGGTPATSVTRLDAGSLEVVTPAHSPGSVSVIVSDPSTGQAAVLAGAFTYGVSGGGGGGCSVADPAPDDPPAEPLAGGAWILALAAILWMRAQRARLDHALGRPLSRS